MRKYILLLILVIFGAKNVSAQYDTIPTSFRNIVKTSPVGYFFNSYSFTYERILTHRLSLAIRGTNQTYSIEEKKKASDHHYDDKYSYETALALIEYRYYLTTFDHHIPSCFYIGNAISYQYEEEEEIIKYQKPYLPAEYHFKLNNYIHSFGPGVLGGFQTIIKDRISVDITTYLFYSINKVESRTKVIANDGRPIPEIDEPRPYLPLLEFNVGFFF